MVRKGQFNKGDLGIYFEIDSKVDTSKDVFKFTEKYNGKIKTQKFSIKDENGNKVGQFWSQGLLMSAEDFGWELIHIEGGKSFIARPSEDKRITSTIDNLYEGDFLTKELGVTYAEGISFYKNAWNVKIYKDKKPIYIGRYKNFKDAVNARREAEEKYYREYSYKNSMEI